MIETSGVPQKAVERSLAGMTERSVTQIVGQDDGLGEVFVEPERARDGAGNLSALQAVRETRSVVVPFVIDEDLGLVLEAPEGA